MPTETVSQQNASDPSTPWSLIEARLLDLDKHAVRSQLQKRFKLWRSERKGEVYYLSVLASDLTRRADLVSDCGLQKDIHKRIEDGALRFDESWARRFSTTEYLVRIELNPEEAGLGRKLASVFGAHGVRRFGLSAVRCSPHDLVIFIEAHLRLGHAWTMVALTDDQIIATASAIYLAELKEFRKQHVTDWEKAVHELASPLDFIYTNSDFLIRYLERTDLDPDLKRKKLEDFKLIADLLIRRLHQFRFAFGSGSLTVGERSHIYVYETCMPITHLWYHEAYRKGLTFRYDELRGVLVKTDPELLQFILFNLVSNAIKYADRNTTIQLYAHRSDRDVKIGIRNQGLAIIGSERGRIFDLGYRAEGAMRRDARGMGIGLAVSRQLASALGGQLVLLDDTGAWTVFELRLPAEL